MRLFGTWLVLAAAGLFLAGCGGDGGGDSKDPNANGNVDPNSSANTATGQGGGGSVSGSLWKALLKGGVEAIPGDDNGQP